MSIATLQARLQDITRRSEAIRAAADAMDRLLTDAERDRLDELADQFDTVEADIRRMETIERQRRAAGGTAPADAGATPAPEVPASGPQPASGSQPAAGPQDRSEARAATAVDPANVRRSESMLIALGVIMGVAGLLMLLLFGDVLSMLIDGGVSLMTFLLGYKALKDGNVATARGFAMTLAIVIFVLLAIQALLALAAADAFLFVGAGFWAMWTIGWLVGCGYLAVHQWLGPKAQRLRGTA